MLKTLSAPSSLGVPPHLVRCRELLWKGTEKAKNLGVYAVLDGARNPLIAARVKTSGLDHECLFKGELSPALSAAAPWLVKLDPESDFVEWLLLEGWGKNWGIYLQSPVPFEFVRRQLRKFLRVKSEDGTFMLFRYYDPRVLRPYLPTTNAEEQAYVFGPLYRFCCEDESGNNLLVHTRDATVFTREEWSLLSAK